MSDLTNSPSENNTTFQVEPTPLNTILPAQENILAGSINNSIVPNNILECKNLTKNYSNNFYALAGVTLSLPRGNIIGLLGPNGSGKTTLIKIIAGMLTPTSGEILVDGYTPGVVTKKKVSYLPDCDYLPNWMKVSDLFNYYSDFFEDFDVNKATDMMQRLGIEPSTKLKVMSKGTKEKVQLILTMSRNADLYLLDEPIGGVDPAARDYILQTIIGSYSPTSTILISTHLIYDIESVLDGAIFLNRGQIALAAPVDTLRAQYGKSINELFRDVFRC